MVLDTSKKDFRRMSWEIGRYIPGFSKWGEVPATWVSKDAGGIAESCDTLSGNFHQDFSVTYISIPACFSTCTAPTDVYFSQMVPFYVMLESFYLNVCHAVIYTENDTTCNKDDWQEKNMLMDGWIGIVNMKTIWWFKWWWCNNGLEKSGSQI